MHFLRRVSFQILLRLGQVHALYHAEFLKIIHIILHAIGKEVAVESTDFAAQLATCIRENSVYR